MTVGELSVRLGRSVGIIRETHVTCVLGLWGGDVRCIQRDRVHSARSPVNFHAYHSKSVSNFESHEPTLGFITTGLSGSNATLLFVPIAAVQGGAPRSLSLQADRARGMAGGGEKGFF